MIWLAHFFGYYARGGNSPAYLFWSGAGSDIGELAIIGGLVALVRRHNCEVHRCWRLGRHATAGGHMVCRLHHPASRLTATAVRDAHTRAVMAAENTASPHGGARGGREADLRYSRGNAATMGQNRD